MLALVDRVLTDPAGEKPLTELEDRLHGAPVDWPALVHDNKRRVADGILRSEVLRIGRELRVALADAPADTEDAVAELLACFPVYRSYLPDGREHLEAALASARSHRPDLAATLDVLAPVLGDAEAAPALRFQQTSGMVMAKGVEDTSFYQWSRLTSLNEVGGDPSVFSVDVDDFHLAMAERQRDWPAAMTTLSTHDTKRGEDVRARITALAEVPDLWAGALDKLLRLVPLPDSAFGSLLWQAILGAWPAAGADDDLRARLHGYAEKAMREAGGRTTWTEPDAAYEAAVHRAVDAAFDVPGARRVLDDLLGRVVDAGWSNALAAKLVALTMPGVPDVYQGSELWEQSLVDPDNRRPVDFESRAALLAELDAGARPAAHRRRRRPRRRQAARHPCGPAAAARPARAVHGLHAADRVRARPPSTCWPSTAAAPSPSSPGCRTGSPPAAAGATRRSRCRRASGSTTGERSTAVGARGDGRCSPSCWPTSRSRCCGCVSRCWRPPRPPEVASTSGRRGRTGCG